MPLVNTKEMFKKAYEGGYAIGAFNCNNMEIVQAITEAAKKCNSPVILQVSAGARKYAKPVYLKKLVEAAVEDTNLPIVLHLDHGADFEICKDCIDSGFTSVMIDASSKSFEENIAITRKIDLYKNEEKMLLDYVIRIGVTPRIKVYFYSKYMHVFNEFDTLSLEDYQSVVDNALENYESLHSVLEQNIRNGLNAKKDEEKINGLSALKEVQAGNYENVDKVKTYYS